MVDALLQRVQASGRDPRSRLGERLRERLKQGEGAVTRYRDNTRLETTLGSERYLEDCRNAFAPSKRPHSPDEVVKRAGAPTRRNRRGPAPPPPVDTWGPVMRVIILTAALTGLRQSEILGLRWRDVDWTAQRIRVRNTWVRGEHSTDGKSDLSTRRSVPAADRLFRLLDQWSQRTAYSGSEDLVFGHPETNAPLDRSKVTKRFKKACLDAGVPVIRFHDLRHTFGTRLASRGVPIRTIQEFLGHADSKTTQIYMHYAPSAHEVEIVNDAFGDGSGEAESDPSRSGIFASE